VARETAHGDRWLARPPPPTPVERIGVVLDQPIQKVKEIKKNEKKEEKKS
jgi:hypothetical protein